MLLRNSNCYYMYVTFYVDNYYNYTWDAVFVQLLKLLSLNWYRQLSKNTVYKKSHVHQKLGKASGHKH